MFLIEGDQGTVLYTGDFRLYRHQSDRHGAVLAKKRIRTLYMDMTFFDPSVPQLPEREQACRALIDFLAHSSDTSFYLKTSARVGYEYIFTSVYRHFGTRLHVHSEQYHLYDCLPQVQQALTTDAVDTQMHVCWPPCSQAKSSIKVGFNRTDLFSVLYLSIQITLSVLWFTMQQQPFHSPLVQISPSLYRLCYSLHSSYNEICAFVRQISPTRVHPIALPGQMTPSRFQELLTHLGVAPPIARDSIRDSAPQPIKQRHQFISQQSTPDQHESDELDFDGHGTQTKSEKQLYQRICHLQQPFTDLNTRPQQ